MTQAVSDTVLKLLSIVPLVIFFLLSKFFFDYNKDIRKDYRTEINENRKITLVEHQIPRMVILCEKALDLLSRSDMMTVEEILFKMAADKSEKRYIDSVNKSMARICRIKIFYFNLRDFSFHLGIVFLIVLVIVLTISIFAVFGLFEDLIKYFLYSLLAFSALIIYLLVSFFRAKRLFDFESDQISLDLRGEA